MKIAIFLIAVMSISCAAHGRDSAPPQTAPPASLSIGTKGWTGVELTTDGEVLKIPGKAVFTVPGDATSVLDASAWYGLRIELEIDRDDAPFTGELQIIQPATPPGEAQAMISSTKASLRVQGKGWHTITLPFTAFNYNRGQRLVLKGLHQLALSGSYEGEKGAGQVCLRDVRFIRGNVLHLASDIRSKPADADGTVEYNITVTNCADTQQVVTLSLERSGWEGMPASIKPDMLTLAPGQSRAATLDVTVPGWLPAGARESQTLVATPQSDSPAAEKMQFITLRRVPFPFLVHTAAEWDEVLAKVQKYDWAKADLAEFVRQANEFQVPDVRPPSAKGVFDAYIERKLWPCAVAWKLTSERADAEKVALFLRRLSDPVTGYPTKAMANSADIPQEGGLWEVAVRSYDMIQDAGILTDNDKAEIEKSFRRYIDWVAAGNGGGGISNWSVFNLCPAAECALALHDMARFEELMNGSGGIIDHLRYGMMDDGWWYEMALSYNLGVADAFTNLGLAERPFGIDFLNEKYPVATTRIVGLRPFEFQNFKGMAFGKFGPVRSNTVSIRKMWDGIVIYPDYRGIMFGMGDGHEEAVGGGAFEKAYYAFRNPAYATVIKQGKKRDLIYGVPDLPPNTPAVYAISGHSDDAGIAVLRSQTPAREPREQIQAVFKYGTHGSYHGHFDRLSLDSLMRYGRSFYNPETSWYGYASYMYKWWVQVSLSHNMAVVDGKMQEPQECRPLLFYSGTMMQAVAAETTARWSNPPYLGGYDQVAGIRNGDIPYVPVPASHPIPGEITGYTEPIYQRRVMIVTDDYVVLADDLRGRHEHTFDNFLQLRGASLADPARSQFPRHDAQFDTDALTSGQFITNVNRYSVGAPALVHSTHRFADKSGEGSGSSGVERNWETGGKSSLSEPGLLRIDEHILWPQKAEIAIGDYAESWPVSKKLRYEVMGDGKSLASGTFGAWILGSGNVDVDVKGVRTIQLLAETGRGKNIRNTIFWGNPIVVTEDGREFPLAQLKPKSTNIIPTPHPDCDYGSGPVRIAGTPFAKSVPGEPQDTRKPGFITVDLSGLNAARFKATVGGDWPVGSEEQLRKVVSVETKGNSAQFLTLMEPFEDKPAVKNATASGADHLRVELADGRVQEIKIENAIGPGKGVAVTIDETKEGKVLRSETTLTSNP